MPNGVLFRYLIRNFTQIGRRDKNSFKPLVTIITICFSNLDHLLISEYYTICCINPLTLEMDI